MDRAHRIAVKQEKVTAANHGGRGTPASGSGDVKNDVRNDDFSFEVKTTTRKTYSLALSTWITAETHAIRDGRRAAMVVCFDQGLGKSPKRLVVISEEDFIELSRNGTAS
jgi:hypothetical protein